MNNYTAKSLILASALVTIFTFIGWGMSVYKLINCDFDSQGTWKAEVVYGIGVVIPPTSLIIGYLDIED